MNSLGSQKGDGLEKVVVVLPAYNAAGTLENTFKQFPKDFRAHFILVDDHSQDRTVELAKSLNIDTVIKHDSNFGYGANQKTCYREALRQGATIIVMLHPDSQYNPQLVPVFVELIKSKTCDIVLGNRIRSRRDALLGGMPKYKYYANRALTLVANICLGTNLGDFHTGFRVYSRAVLESVSWESNANDFSFDPELLTKAVLLGFRIGDVPILPAAISLMLHPSISKILLCMDLKCSLYYSNIFGRGLNGHKISTGVINAENTGCKHDRRGQEKAGAEPF
jgi:glycosyltransferase involved in cell wall biosynthesis